MIYPCDKKPYKPQKYIYVDENSRNQWKGEKVETLVVVWRRTPFAFFHLYLFLPRAILPQTRDIFCN